MISYLIMFNFEIEFTQDGWMGGRKGEANYSIVVSYEISSQINK